MDAKVGKKRLNIADLHTLFQRGKFIAAFRHKLLCYKAFKTSFEYSFHDGRVVQLLCFVYFITAGNTAGMVVGKIRVIFLDGADNVAFHDLHMINIV